MANIFRRKSPITTPVVVIGLGRFGSSLANELLDHGVEVLGIDMDEKNLRGVDLTEAVLADSTDPEALRQLGVEEIERAVVAIGSDLEASILTASNIVELGVKDIWAKADSEAHARILSQIGVHHVIRPERDTGKRVAHLLGGKFEEFAELASNYGVTTLSVPPALTEKPVDVEATWREHKVQLVSVRTDNGVWAPIETGQVLTPSDYIVVAGSPIALEKFGEATR